MRRIPSKLVFSCVFAALGVLLVIACSGKDEVIEVPVPNCPDAAPQAGGEAGLSCDVPETKNCYYEGTGQECEPKGVTAKCTNKQWVITPGPINQPGCPTTIPTTGQACPACFDTTIVCKYTFRCGGVMTDDVYRATCDGKTWTRTTNKPCSLPDAGPDVL
jgi:hypothetical protein